MHLWSLRGEVGGGCVCGGGDLFQHLFHDGGIHHPGQLAGIQLPQVGLIRPQKSQQHLEPHLLWSTSGDGCLVAF